MITRGFLTNTIITRGYGIHYIIELGKACIEFIRTTTIRNFVKIKTIKDFIRGC